MLRLFFCAIVLVVVMGTCSKAKKTITRNVDAYSAYINAYPKGFLKSKSNINIYFTRKAIDSSRIGSNLNLNEFAIKPSLAGSAKWVNEYTISFEPDESKIDRSISYVASVNLKSIFQDVPDSLQMFSFELTFVPIIFQVEWDFLHSDEQNDGAMSLEGILTSTDNVSVEKIEKSILAKVNHQVQPLIRIVKLDNEFNSYQIKISNIQRSEEDLNLVVEWKSDPDKNETRMEQSFSVPSRNIFIVTGLKEDREDPKCLMVYFSDKLDATQDLRGLISINRDSVKPSFVIEKDIVHVNFKADEFRTGELTVHDKIKNVNGKNLSIKFSHTFKFEEELPAVRILGKGKVLPYSKNVILPFEAINLNYVDVEIFKIFSNNVLYNLHLNDYDNEYMMTKLGKVVHQQTINLKELQNLDNRTKWISYGLDLSKLINPELGAMYEVRLIFRPQYSSYRCKDAKMKANPRSEQFDLSSSDSYNSWWAGYGFLEIENDSEPGKMINRDNHCYEYNNPCCIAYYTSENFSRLSFIASNLAVMVKHSNNQHEMMITVYDVISSVPVKNANVKIYDRQLQELKSVQTDGSGMISCKVDGTPGYVLANDGRNYAYLKLDESLSITTSEFEIDGVQSKDGIKSFVFMERGIWRPGDTIHGNLLLNQEGNQIPKNFPVQIELRSPSNQQVQQIVLNSNSMGLYYFKLSTLPTDITGRYSLKIRYGSSELVKTLQIETIKPNRFKFDWIFDDNLLYNSVAKINAQFLHGFPASEKKINIKAHISNVVPEFKRFNKFSFFDPSLSNNFEIKDLYEGLTKSDGSVNIKIDDIKINNSYGKISATFISEIMDEGGDLSTDYTTKIFDEYDEYVGIQMPETNYESYYSDQKLSGVKVACVDRKGNPLSNRQLKVELFYVDRSWWYEIRRLSSEYSENANYVLSEVHNCTTDSKGLAEVSFNLKRYNSYFIKVSSSETDHTAGSLFYTGWNFNSTDQSKDYVQLLNLTTDKEKYKIGEQCKMELPGSALGTLIINVIRNNKIIKTDVIKSTLPKTHYNFTITQEMFPNVYVDVTMIQGLEKKNDLPLRLYGIVPVMVENESVRLKPNIVVKEIVRPEEEFIVEISEFNSSEMSYQLMIVDDGLLGITKYKTPDSYSAMFAKEALTMLSWDNYDQIMGNDLSALSKIYSIGGDQKISSQDLAKMKRFKPVVLITGPQYLKSKGKNIHKFKISNYIGSVRVMVVANNYKAFGSADKTVTVRDELAAQITFPRVVSVSDHIFVPITLFKYDDKLNSANVELTTIGPLEIVAKQKQFVQFGSNKEITVWFELKTKGDLGAAAVECIASSGSIKTKSRVDFYVVNPNPITTQAMTFVLEPRSTKQVKIQEYGVKGTQKIVLELSGIPKLKSEKYLKDLINYPHGCVEQITSSAFPQLYLADFLNLSQTEMSERSLFVSTAINKLAAYQLQDGGIGYWPGYQKADDYCSSYICHFLSEAKNKGFALNPEVYNKLIEYLTNVSNNYKIERYNPKIRSSSNFLQTYRLFALSIAQHPNWGAMNRLRMNENNHPMSVWLLAGAYALAGKKEIALELVKDINKNVVPYSESDYSYGSDIRDESLISLVLHEIGNKTEAIKVLKDVILKINNESYASTQEMSMVLLATGKIYSKVNLQTQNISANYSWNGGRETLSSDYSTIIKKLTGKVNNDFSITNSSTMPITVNLVQSGKIAVNQKLNVSNGLKLRIDYHRKDLKPFSLNDLKQGDRLVAKIELSNLTNRDLKNIAVTAIFPAGFELVNRRIGGLASSNFELNYEDYRDDRLICYLGMKKAQTVAFQVELVASYAGNFFAPIINAESMYEPEINSQYCEGIIKIRM
ncbi:MAG: hypothetical protein IT267_04245 [Saprospiraceae bacterium]|nr:hypothetical protein [Saprospiraceae bacterium]